MNPSFKIFCNISSVVATLVCLSKLAGMYIYACLLPISFFFFLNLICVTRNIWYRRPLTSYIITTMLWMRMVLLPLYGALSGAYSDTGVAPELSQHFIGSISLCIYDCIAIAITLVIFFKINDKTPRSYITKGLFGNANTYFIFVAFALIVFFTIGRSMHLFDFAIKPINDDLERSGDLVGGIEMIIRQIVSSGLQFLFLLVIWWLKKKYDYTKDSKFFYWSLICAALLISIIVGERRTAQVYIAFASGYVLLSLYPKKRKMVVLYVGITVVFVLAMMTIYKQLYGFMYSSYAEAIQNASISEGFSYELMDDYFYGIETISKNIHYGNMMDVGYGQFFYDFFRNIFGLNVFVSSSNLLTTQIYNSIIYSGVQLTGLLLSSVGYGYIFSWYAFAPIITIFNVIMMLLLEKFLRRSNSIEWQFIWAYVFMRIGFGVLSSPPPLINSISRFLIINAIIIGFARIFKTTVSK